MKKTLITSIVLLGFGAGQLLAPAAYAQETNTNAAKTQNPETAAPPKLSTVKTEKDWFDILNMRIDLGQARVAVLRAKVALEIEKSNDRAKQALDDAEAGYMRAKDAAKSKASKDFGKLVDNIITAKNAVTKAPEEAKKKIDELLEQTEDSLQGYGQVALNTDEAKLLKKRYAQLEAEAALLKAKIAEKVDNTGKQANSYLDEAKNWYAKAKSNSTKEWHKELEELSRDIDNTKKVIAEKRNQAADAITNLADRAANLVRAAKSEKPTK